VDTVVIASFRYRHEADFARSFLDLEGVDSFVAGDDAGGMQPGIMSGARVIVRAEDEQRAREILSRQQNIDSSQLLRYAA
jgi:hypothetical protein